MTPLLTTTVIAGLVVAVGPVLDRIPPRPALGFGGVLAVVAVVVVERTLDDATPLVRMLGICAVLLYATKNLVCAAARQYGGDRLRRAPRLAFTLGWFGMNPRTFARRRRRPLPGVRALVVRGTRNAAAGAMLVLVACTIGGVSGALVLMVGLSLILHFGAFHLLAALWRQRGYACHALFVAPWRARTLHEFWTRRWNVGFAEMTALLVQRRLRRRAGPETARVASFLFSGLLHELAISLPVRAGYGLPTAYFVLHALAARRHDHGRTWTLAWVLLPAPLMFHPWFVRGVVMPMLGAP